MLPALVRNTPKKLACHSRIKNDLYAYTQQISTEYLKKCHCLSSLSNTASASCTKPERFGRQLIDQSARYDTISNAENYRPKPERKRRHLKPHKIITEEICHRHHDPVRPALNLCPRIIGLEKIVNRQIMYGKEHTDTQHRDDQHEIIHRLCRPA